MKKRRRRKKRKTYNLIISAVLTIILAVGTYNIFKIVNNTITSNKNLSIKIENHKNDISKNDINKNENNSIVEENSKEEPVVENNKEESITNKSKHLSLGEDPYADSAKDIQTRLNSWDFLREDGKKVAYLTFDDGPSNYVTKEILDVLKQNDVKATFFVLGSMIEKSDIAKENLIRMAEEGHSIANHGYCHRYDVLYPEKIANPSAFLADMEKSENVMKSVLGQDFSTRVIRFPGGHATWNTEELDLLLEEQGYAYVDWNVLNGDAEGENLSSTHLLNRLQECVNDLYGNDDVVVILMHDTDAKETTAQYLQDAINYLKDLGYEFRTLKN